MNVTQTNNLKLTSIYVYDKTLSLLVWKASLLVSLCDKGSREILATFEIQAKAILISSQKNSYSFKMRN